MTLRPLPATVISPQTGALLTRGVREVDVTWKSMSRTVRQPGYYNALDSADCLLVGEDLKPADDALAELIALAEMFGRERETTATPPDTNNAVDAPDDEGSHREATGSASTVESRRRARSPLRSTRKAG